MNSGFHLGVRIFESPLAVNMVWRVECVRPRSRRKRYSAVRRMEPGCYQTPLGLFMHPEVYRKLTAQFGAAPL